MLSLKVALQKSKYIKNTKNLYSFSELNLSSLTIKPRKVNNFSENQRISNI